MLIGNWKMHGDGRALPAIGAIAAMSVADPALDVALCLPATLIHRAATRYPALTIGAQDCHSCDGGAHTGDIAASMLRDAGARLVILGHSERRRHHREDDGQIAAKVLSAQAAGLNVVLCVGEPDDAGGPGRASAAVTEQLARSLDGARHAGLTIAYEPVWAIGSGTTPEPERVAAMADHIRSRTSARFGDRVPVLYGGSVTPRTCRSLYVAGDVDGFLVGQASLDPDTFRLIGDLLRAA